MFSKTLKYSRLIIFSLVFTAIILSLPENLNWSSLIKSFNGTAFVLSMLSSFACIIFVSFRFKYLSSFFLVRLSFLSAYCSTLNGQLYSLVSHQLIGNVVGRKEVFQNNGGGTASLALLTLIEKAFSFLFIGSAAIFCLFYISEELEIETINYGLYSYWSVFFPLATLVYLSLQLRNFFDKNFLVNLKIKQAAIALFFSSLYTAFSVLSVLCVYILLVVSINVNIEIERIIATSMIIMFLSSLPISVNGWGVRELFCIILFTDIGLSVEQAVFVGLMVGFISTATIILAAIISNRFLGSNSLARAAPDKKLLSVDSIRIERLAVYIICLSVTMLVYFQAHLSFNFGTVNVNLADPFACVLGVAVFISFFQKKIIPKWRVDWVNGFLISFFIASVIALLNGFIIFGSNEQALLKRFFALFVLFGYFSTGVAVALHLGQRYSLRLLSISLFVLLTVILFSGFERMLFALFDFNSYMRTNYSGFSANRNVFSFQLLSALVIFMSLSNSRKLLVYKPFFDKRYIRGDAPKLASYYMKLIVLANIATGSTTGHATFLLLLAFCWVLRLCQPVLLKSLFQTGIAGLLAFYIFDYTIYNHILNVSGYDHHLFNVSGAKFSSFAERTEQMKLAVSLILERPLFGNGLGGFVQESSEIFGYPVVLHNTFLGLLVDFGLVLSAVILLPATLVFWSLSKKIHTHRCVKAAFLIVIIAASFSMMHEILYQRFLWLQIGMLLALPIFIENKNLRVSMTENK